MLVKILILLELLTQIFRNVELGKFTNSCNRIVVAVVVSVVDLLGV